MIRQLYWWLTSRSTAADPETSERGGARNMKYKPPRVVAIFFWPIFYRPGGGGAWPPCPPPWIRYWSKNLTVSNPFHLKCLYSLLKISSLRFKSCSKPPSSMYRPIWLQIHIYSRLKSIVAYVYILLKVVDIMLN